MKKTKTHQDKRYLIYALITLIIGFIIDAYL